MVPRVETPPSSREIFLGPQMPAGGLDDEELGVVRKVSSGRRKATVDRAWPPSGSQRACSPISEDDVRLAPRPPALPPEPLIKAPKQPNASHAVSVRLDLPPPPSARTGALDGTQSPGTEHSHHRLDFSRLVVKVPSRTSEAEGSSMRSPASSRSQGEAPKSKEGEATKAKDRLDLSRLVIKVPSKTSEGSSRRSPATASSRSQGEAAKCQAVETTKSKASKATHASMGSMGSLMRPTVTFGEQFVSVVSLAQSAVTANDDMGVTHAFAMHNRAGSGLAPADGNSASGSGSSNASLSRNWSLFRSRSEFGSSDTLKLELHYRPSGSDVIRIASAEIQPEILRGAWLSTSLRSFGALWRTSPIDLDEERREKLWELSGHCDKLDGFVSQSWLTPGWQKYLAMLVGFYKLRVTVVGVACTALLVALEMAGHLPLFELNVGEEDTTMFSPWATLAPFVVLAVMFAGPVLSSCCPCCPDSRIFFDALCINQSDDDLKQAGIDSLAGFLANSDKLYVLWTPTYFTRMWCVYEIAMFSALCDDSDIVFWPPFVYSMWFFGFIFVAVSILLLETFLIAFHARWEPSVEMIPPVLLLWPPLALLTNLWRPFLRHKADLDVTFSHFDINEAECREERDREFITRSINHWYGSMEIFNDYVRNHLKRLACDNGGDSGEHYPLLVSILSPAIAFQLEWLLAMHRMHRAGESLESIEADVVHLVRATCTCFLVLPTILKLFSWVLQKCPEVKSSRTANVCLDAALASCLGAAFIGAEIAAQELTRSIPGVAVFVAASAAAALFAFAPDAWSRFQRRPLDAPPSSPPAADRMSNRLSRIDSCSLSGEYPSNAYPSHASSFDSPRHDDTAGTGGTEARPQSRGARVVEVFGPESDAGSEAG